MTKNEAAAPFEEATVTIEYGPIRPNHESKLALRSFDGLAELGMLFESKFEQGKLTLYLELTEYPDETRGRELIAAILDEAYGAVAVAKAKVSFQWI